MNFQRAAIFAAVAALAGSGCSAAQQHRVNATVIVSAYEFLAATWRIARQVLNKFPRGKSDADPGAPKPPPPSITTLSTSFLFGFVLAVVSATGCAGRQYTPPENALLAVHSVAHGLAAADAIVAPRCGVSSPAPECSRFVEAYDVMRASLIVAERAVDEWRRIGTGSQCAAREALRGARGDLDAVLTLLDAMHVAVPDEVQSAIRQLASLINSLAPVCNGGV